MPDPVRDPDRPDDLFHVVPFQYLHGDGPQCLFLVTRLRDGDMREIVVRQDEQGFSEFIVDMGAAFYDIENEPLYLTLPLMDDTARTLERVRDANTKADRIIAINSMRPPFWPDGLN